MHRFLLREHGARQRMGPQKSEQMSLQWQAVSRMEPDSSPVDVESNPPQRIDLVNSGNIGSKDLPVAAE